MHPRLTRILTAGMVTGIVIGLATPAWATGSGGAWTDDAGVGARAGDGASGPGSGGAGGSGSGGTGSGGGGGGGSASACTYTALDSRESRIANDMVTAGMLTGGSGPGGWYRQICPGSGVVLWVGAAAAAAPVVVVDPRALAMEALGRARIPDPVIGMSPPADQDQIVNLPTWLWVGGWQPVTATAAAGGVTVTVTATPDHVDWAMGNGDRISCGAGRAYDASRSSGQTPSCSYTYRASSARAPGSAFRLSATTTWRIAWAATGISASGELPAATRTSSVTVRVAEIQAINHGDDRTGGPQ